MLSGFAPSLTPTHPESPALWFLVAETDLLVRVEAASTRPFFDTEIAELSLSSNDATWIGAMDGRDCAVMALPPGFAVPQGFELRGIRSLFGAWPNSQVFVAGVASQVLDFEATHRLCGRRGSEMVREVKERARRCPACGFIAYPRISPALIVLVRRGREALLARSGRFPLPFYSALAGFVEVGESLEDTVTREIREEVGITVKELRYFGSQPWPFPHSFNVSRHLLCGYIDYHLPRRRWLDIAHTNNKGWIDNNNRQTPGDKLSRLDLSKIF
jgi:NAD+ diphosphatase